MSVRPVPHRAPMALGSIFGILIVLLIILVILRVLGLI